MLNIFGLSVSKLTKELEVLSLPKFRAKQILEWVYKKGLTSFADMTNLPIELREKLKINFSIKRAKVITKWMSKNGETEKFLLEFEDGNTVETVLMRHKYGNSVCLSTQVGCAMGCAFCASTLNGIVRNLTCGEILDQLLFISEQLSIKNEKINSIVLMGSGEPLMNYNEVLLFLHLIHEKYVLNMSYRSIAISTSGIIPKIYDLAKENLPVTLSISLHAPNDTIRSEIMPINKKYKIKDLIDAAIFFEKKTHRRVTYEYILIKDINDKPEHARELSKLLKNQLANVNLIPINPVTERNLNRPSERTIQAFEQILKNNHISVTRRREMGTDIQAACGQLRNKHTSDTN